MSLGYYADLKIGDVKDEIFDMIKPKEDLKITLKELLDSEVKGRTSHVAREKPSTFMGYYGPM